MGLGALDWPGRGHQVQIQASGTNTGMCFTKTKIKKKTQSTAPPFSFWFRVREKESLPTGSMVPFQETQKIMINKGVTVDEVHLSQFQSSTNN